MNLIERIEGLYRRSASRGLSIGIVDRIMRPEGHPRAAGLFSSLPECLGAIEKIRRAGFERLIVHSPLPSHEIEEAMGKGQSMVRWFTLIGAVLGGAGGFALTAWTSLQWDLVVSGKPIISAPPFLIITFECTILGGAIATLTGFLHSARIPQPLLSEVYRDRFGQDVFGIGVVCEEGEVERAMRALFEAGALEVYHAAAQ